MKTYISLLILSVLFSSHAFARMKECFGFGYTATFKAGHVILQKPDGTQELLTKDYQSPELGYIYPTYGNGKLIDRRNSDIIPTVALELTIDGTTQEIVLNSCR